MGLANVRNHATWQELEALFPKYLSGDGEATRVLFGELQRVLRGFFRVRLNSETDCEDLAQATLLKVHFARDRFDTSQSLKTWVFTIASRSLIDHWRGASAESELRQFESPVEDGEIPASILDSVPSSLLDPAMKTELYNDLNNALMKLKPMERTIVYLYGVEELSMKEIAQILSITEGATKLRAHRAYQELRGILGSLALVIVSLTENKWM